jgi:regulatory protein
VRRRAPALGQARIRQELARHGLELAPEAAGELKASELERARSLWLRRYGEPANSVAERAKQARFLAARGFSVDTIARVVGGRED